ETDSAEAAIEQFRQIAAELAPLAGTFALPLTMIADADAVGRIVSALLGALHGLGCRLLVVVDVDHGEPTAAGLALAAVAAGADGVIVDLTQVTADETVLRGPDCRESA